MIEVTNLTKRYAGRTALSGISFSVGKGEIAGLLGPNGRTLNLPITTCSQVRIGG